MKRLLCLGLLALSLLPSSGCTLLRRNREAKPKPVTAIAADTDARFRTLWLGQREKELTAGGLTPAAATAKAEEEYASKYGYTRPATR
jgi:hypothetical protein